MASSEVKIRYEIVEQDQEPVAIKVKKVKETKVVKIKEDIDTDKPAAIISSIDQDARVQLKKDAVEILHSFHSNGRSLTQLHKRTKEILQDRTKVKLILIKAPVINHNDKELCLINKMYVQWGISVFGFLGEQKPNGDFLVFIQDIISNNIYMPCCHDVKPISQTQLALHYKVCLSSKLDGTKCAFCNSTDLESNTFTTVNLRKEHMTQNNHIDSIYLVLNYVEGGLKMVDARISDTYIANRPFANYFLRNDSQYFGYTGLIEFLRAHVPVWQVERTPIFKMLDMYKRKAVNAKKNFFKLPCASCDCTFPAFTGFYLGIILQLEKVDCQCEEGSAYILPIAKIDELYKMVQQVVTKDNSTASKSLLLQIFENGQQQIIDQDGSININIDIDQLIESISIPVNTTIICGEQYADGNAIRGSLKVKKRNQAGKQTKQRTLRTRNGSSEPYKKKEQQQRQIADGIKVRAVKRKRNSPQPSPLKLTPSLRPSHGSITTTTTLVSTTPGPMHQI